MDEYDNFCPLCIKQFDEQDQQFVPCKCKFRICMWCWRTILDIAENEIGRCPNCREPYDMEFVKAQRVKKNTVPPRRALGDKKPLADLTLLDRKVVAVRGLAPPLLEHPWQRLYHSSNTSADSIAEESNQQRQRPHVEAIYQHFLFGQYGRIVDVVLSRSSASSTAFGAAYLYDAQIRFSSTEEAAACVRCADKAVLMGQPIRCFLAKTKYCTHFLRNASCLKKHCVDLHVEQTDKNIIVRGVSAATLNPLDDVSADVVLSVQPLKEMIRDHTKSFVSDIEHHLVRKVGEQIGMTTRSFSDAPERSGTQSAGDESDVTGHTPTMPPTSADGATKKKRANHQQTLGIAFANMHKLRAWLDSHENNTNRNFSRRKQHAQASDSRSDVTLATAAAWLAPGMPPHRAGLALPSAHQHAAMRRQRELTLTQQQQAQS